jgi:hypothetical protein
MLIYVHLTSHWQSEPCNTSNHEQEKYGKVMKSHLSEPQTLMSIQKKMKVKTPSKSAGGDRPARPEIELLKQILEPPSQKCEDIIQWIAERQEISGYIWMHQPHRE